MLFTGAHWYVGVLQIMLLAAETACAFRFLSAHRVVNLAFIRCAGAYLFLYKLFEYVSKQIVPLDFSVLSYFLMGVSVAVPLRQVRAAASFSAFLSGLIYTLSMIIFPETHFDTALSTEYCFFAMFNHNLLYIGSLGVSACYVFRRDDVLWIMGWLGIFVCYAYIVAHRFGVGVTTIMQILDGSVINLVFPDFVLAPWYYAVYYIGCAAALCLIIAAVFAVNRRFHRGDSRILPPLDRRALLHSGMNLQH